MNASTQPIALRAAPVGGLRVLTAGSILLLLGAALALAAYNYPPPSIGPTVVAGVALTGVLALALARYEAAAAIGFLLLGVQAVEPAPADAVFGIVIAVAVVTGRFDATRVPLTIFATLGALLVLNVTSMISALDPGRAAFFFTITLYLAVFSVWLTGFLDSVGRARLVVLAYLTTAVASAVIGVLALFFMPGNDQLVYGAARARAFFADANVFGPFMVPIILIMIEEILQPRLVGLRRATKVVLVFVLAAAVLFSYSRAAWLNAVVAVVVLLGVLAVRRGGSRQLAPTVLVLVAILVAGSVLVSASGSEEFLEQRASGQSYDADRFAAQETGIRLAEQHPLGIGPGQFETVVGISTHSTYIRTFAEQGILGFVALIGLALSTLVLALRNAALGRHTYGIGSAALLAAWCGLLVNGFFVDTVHWRHLWLVAALIWAGSLRGAALDRGATRTWTRPPPAPPPRQPRLGREMGAR